MKILIVEDNALIVKVISTILLKEGHELLEAKDGSEGLEMYEKNEDIQIVVTDLIMPKVDGFEVIKKIKDDPNRQTRILVISGSDSIHKALDAGADAILKKPLNATSLTNNVRELEAQLQTAEI